MWQVVRPIHCGGEQYSRVESRTERVVGIEQSLVCTSRGAESSSVGIAAQLVFSVERWTEVVVRQL